MGFSTEIDRIGNMTNKAKSSSPSENFLPKPELSKSQIEETMKNFLESKKGLNFLLENTISLIILFDEKKRVFYVNTVTMKRNLFPADLLIGQSLEVANEFCKKVGPQQFFEEINLVLETLKKVDQVGIIKDVEFQLMNAEGGFHEIICDFGKIIDGKNIFYAMVGLDVSDRVSLKILNKQLLSPTGLPGRMLENSSDIVGLLNKDGMVQFINGAYKSISGYSMDEMVGHSFFEFVVNDDRSKVRTKLAALKKTTGLSEYFRYRIKTKNGDIRYLETIGNNLLHDPVINGIIINSRDVTEQVIVEEKYGSALNAMEDLIFNLDENLKITLCNASYAKWAKRFGWVKNPIGKRIDKVSNVKDSAIQELIAVVQKKKKITGELKYNFQGEDLYFSVTKSPIIKDEKLMGILVVIRDETKRRVSEIERKATENYLKNVIDESKSIIFVIDANRKVAFWNKATEEATGIKPTKVVGKYFPSLEVFSKDASIQNYFECIEQGLEDSIDEIYLYCSDEHARLFKIKALPLSGVSDEGLMGVLFMGREFSSIGKRAGRLKPGDCIYLVDNKWKDSFNLVGDYLSESKKGLIVTREEKTKMMKIDQFNCEALLLGNDVAVGSEVSALNQLLKSIKDFLTDNANAIVLLDRIDYLVSLYSFSNVMGLLYRLCSVVRNAEAVLLVRLNREVVDDNEFALLSEELSPLPGEKVESIEIDKTNLNILKLIMLKNDTNLTISFKDVGRELDISKVTVSKRIGMLLDFGLVVVNRKGKSKHIHITRKGRGFLEQRMVN